MRYLILAICLLVGSNSWAGIGTVTENKGDACSIQRGKDKMTGTKGAGIESNDTYVTAGCVSNITFKDNSNVKITENSRLLIDDFVFDPNKSDAGKMALKVGMGTVRFASGQIEKNNAQQVSIKTPTASIAVRGTDFTMTVDEAGQSLVVLLPSCKDEKDIKKYELEENRCKVGMIDVSTSLGTVTLDKAFEATFVISNTLPPTTPAILNTVESKINNMLIISQPQEVIRGIKNVTGKSKKEEEESDLEAEAARRLALMVAASQKQIDETRLLLENVTGGSKACDPQKAVCVSWDKPSESDIQNRGKGTAFRITPNEHYAEVKTEGYSSNTFVSITHNDNYAYTLIGDGSPGGNIVNIKQNTGVVKVKTP
jgi:FecR protein